jgi:alkyl hydroperoxide reductase subunit F
MYDLMIIGGGPAGLAASVYAARKQLKTLLLTVDIGGQINTTLGVENYLGYQFVEAPELISKFEAQVKQYPIDQKIGLRVTRLDAVEGGFEANTDDGQTFQGRAVVFATGKRPRQLGVPGEKEFAGRGVSYCATCDGPLFADRRVVVVGGGNSALEAALDLAQIATHVHLVSLTPLTGDEVLQDKVRALANLTLYIEANVTKITGEIMVQNVVVKDLASGRETELEAGGVFIEIGLDPNSEAVAHLVTLNHYREVKINSGGETGVTGLYAAGDVTDVPEKQIVVAAGEGAKATLQAHRYLQRLT